MSRLAKARQRSRPRLTTAPVAAGASIRQPIPDTLAGINFEVKRMKDYVDFYSGDPSVVTITRRLVDTCRPQDELCESRRIYEALLDSTRFVKDPTKKELIQTPQRMLAEIGERGITSGDCDELSTLLATMLSAIGHRPQFRFGARDFGWQHVWVQDEINGRLVDLDLAERQPFGRYLSFKRYGVGRIWE